MGYVDAFDKSQTFPSAAIAITQKYVEFLFFPFRNVAGEHLLTAVHLHVDLCKKSWKVETNCLFLLAFLSCSSFKQIVVEHHKAEAHHAMRKIKVITDSRSK